MNVNFLYDALNDFGNRTSLGTFPNTINMGDASAERMTVDLKLPDGPIAGGPLTLSVDGSDSENGTYTAIVTGSPVSAAALNQNGYSLPMPKTSFKFLRARIAGTAITGTVQALINSYTGK
jgi:hypothetical protein